MGPNGAGKSTLLHVAALLRWPERGDGLDRRRASDTALAPASCGGARRWCSRRRCSLTSACWPTRPVDSASAGANRREAERRAIGWLERFGVGHLARQNARRLSGGEAQSCQPGPGLRRRARAALARRTVRRPRSGDPSNRWCPSWRRDCTTTQTAAVIVTHDATDALALADRLLVLVNGCIAQCDRTDIVLAQTTSVTGGSCPVPILTRHGV